MQHFMRRDWAGIQPAEMTSLKTISNTSTAIVHHDSFFVINIKAMLK